MKLTDIRPQVESSGDMEEQFFSIKDQGMIFDILRNKMYSNPILAICREITSNARDAHREVGKPLEQVVIHLPNHLEPEYKVKDFGPGISPDRMSNVFIQYTASTKRDDNTQTGGFGLGAKTPFSYSDSFVIITCHNGIKYSYSCFIDSTKVGKLSLMSKEITDAPNGTEISIPVKPVDFLSFRQYTEHACRHWEALPKIQGDPIAWPTFNKVLEGKNWAIAKSHDYNQSIKLIIDGIEYPLDMQALSKYADSKLVYSIKGSLMLYFGVGELSLSASREQIYLDKPTQDKIVQRLKDIVDEIRELAINKIDAFPTLWDANVFYRKELSETFSNLDFLGILTWKGSELNNGYVYIKCRGYTFTKGRYSRTGTDPKKLTRSVTSSINFQENSELYVNDLNLREPTVRHVRKAFDDNPALNSLQIICPNDIQSEADLNKNINLDKLTQKKLSMLTKASGRNYTAGTSRLLIFKFDTSPSLFRQVSYDSMDEDTNEQIICLMSKDSYDRYSGSNRQALLSNKKTVQHSALKAMIESNPNISIYGVDKDTDADRVVEEFGNFKTLDDFITEKVIDSKTINFVEIKFANNNYHNVDHRMVKHLDALKLLVLDSKSDFITRLELHNKIESLNGLNTELLHLYEDIKGEIIKGDLDDFSKNNPDWDIEKINTAYDIKYPLMHILNPYNLTIYLKQIAQYVNLIDKV